MLQMRASQANCAYAAAQAAPMPAGSSQCPSHAINRHHPDIERKRARNLLRVSDPSSRYTLPQNLEIPLVRRSCTGRSAR